MTNTGSVAIGLAILLVSALARDASAGGYSCGGSAHGLYGHAWVNFHLNEKGEFSDSMGAWEFTTPYTPAKNPTGDTVLRRDTELMLTFKTDGTDPFKPLRPARLFVQQVVDRLPTKPTYLYLTLPDGRYARAVNMSASRIRDLRESKWSWFSSNAAIDAPAFLDAFLHTPSLAVDVIQIDGVAVSRSVLYLKDGASEVQRLHAKAVEDSKNFRTACADISGQSIEE